MFLINHGHDANKLVKGEIEKEELTKQCVGNKTIAKECI